MNSKIKKRYLIKENIRKDKLIDNLTLKLAKSESKTKELEATLSTYRENSWDFKRMKMITNYLKHHSIEYRGKPITFHRLYMLGVCYYHRCLAK